jgi:rod shape-determining protein MreB
MKIGIDLGTANIMVFVSGQGIVMQEPSVVAVDENLNIVAVGEEAREMIGRTPSTISAIRPMRDGVIADYVITEALLRHFIGRVQQTRRFGFGKPVVMISVPAGVTSVEKRAVSDAAIKAGADKAFLIEEPMAAAIGAGLPITESRGSMVVDIGGGTTEVAIFSLGGIVISRSMRVAGDEMDEDIIQYMRTKYNLLIGERMAERAKMEIGSAYPLPEERSITMRGRNLVTGLPEAVDVSSIEIREALSPTTQVIVDTIKDALDETPPELIADLMESGICMAGGGSQLSGLSERLSEEVNMRVWVAEDPMTCVARGAGRVLEDYDNLRRLLVGLHRGSTHH